MGIFIKAHSITTASPTVKKLAFNVGFFYDDTLMQQLFSESTQLPMNTNAQQPTLFFTPAATDPANDDGLEQNHANQHTARPKRKQSSKTNKTARPSKNASTPNSSHADGIKEKQQPTEASTIKTKPAGGLRILHTSDWHIGKRLHNEARYAEFGELLDWMVKAVDSAQADVLLVAGDIFDTMTPSNRAQELYYQFLGKLNASHCRHVIITAGNHDSPSFLDAPKSLLKAFSVHVVGVPSADIDEEIFTLNDDDGVPELIVAAVPYLRDKDVRQAVLGESSLDKERSTVHGINAHYAAVASRCQARQSALMSAHNKRVPIVATGHLFVVGAQKSADDDDMRDLYVGSLGAVTADVFADTFDYVALGHIHRAQKVGGHNHVRYSGSPMAMGFGEVGAQKSVTLVDFCADAPPDAHTLSVPTFRQLVRITGDWAAIENAIHMLKTEQQANNSSSDSTSAAMASGDKLGIHISAKPIWLDISYTGKTVISDLSERIATLIDQAPLAALNIKNKQLSAPTLRSRLGHPNLKSLSAMDVFCERLKGSDVSDETALKDAYQHLLQKLQDEDAQAD